MLAPIMRHAIRSTLACASLVALSLGPGCSCARKPDEEILKEKIDTVSVHLYLATKSALVREGDPDAKSARERFLAVVSGAEKVGAPDVSLGDVGGLAKDLWGMRAEGKRILASGEDAKPFVPTLLREPALAKAVDASTEHALLLGGLFLVKFHPQSPAPIPEPILLYEAWMTKPEKVQLPGTAPAFHAIKAIVYGGNELCDLAAREAKAAGEGDGAAAFGQTSKLLFGAELAPKQLEPAFGAARGVAHGMAGVCYLERGEPEKAATELDAFCDEAEKLGTPTGELGLVRAWVALSRKDVAKAKKHLEDAKASAKSPEDKKAIEELAAKLDSDPKALAAYLGKGRLALFAIELGYRHVAGSGVLDAVGKSDVGRVLGSFGRATGAVMSKAKEVTPSWEDAKGGAKALWDRATK